MTRGLLPRFVPLSLDAFIDSYLVTLMCLLAQQSTAWINICSCYPRSVAVESNLYIRYSLFAVRFDVYNLGLDPRT
ncbi:hypothetical protein BDV41DRAFT_520733 [Aspergillus transmontanensis]|uniref:Uncharacterized protein n=1 Tax=Aspergillus transmontanensis TaxID=1034304 RepID=A0A5N6WGU2_9EURO|nr:hypothetical protein BDV41DRAFT_520733 [Aspergillus transmontanensis]